MNAEHRKTQRYRLPARVPVYNGLSGSVEGVLGNLSSDGLMLIADHPFHEESLFQLSFKLPDPSDPEARVIELGAQCLWCDSAASAGTYWAGFKIVDVSSEDLHFIQQVLKAVSESTG